MIRVVMKIRTRQKWNEWKEKILDILYPQHIKCIFCGEELNEKALNDTCEKCFKELPFLEHICSRCGGPIGDNNDGICQNCKANNFYFTLARSVFAYNDQLVAVIHKYKYGDKRYLYEPLGRFMCDYFSTWEISPDMITSIPLHKAKEKSRGYNQSKLLAEFISKKFSIPYYDLCEKVVNNVSQTELDLHKRKQNVKDVYEFDKNYKSTIKDKIILLIDDIFTTGSTTSEMSRILKKAGAREIYVLTLAHGLGDNREGFNKEKHDKEKSLNES